jgi:hypothetical protein
MYRHYIQIGPSLKGDTAAIYLVGVKIEQK